MPTIKLTVQERRVVKVLREDWRDVLRCTTIDQAMERAGVRFSPASRLRLAKFLMSSAKDLMRWAPSTYVLTREEKLVARRLLRCWRERRSIPQAGEDVTATSARSVDRTAYEILAWLGFLRKRAGRYELDQTHTRFLGGLGFHFHEVMLPGRNERFSTNCAPDFFIMAHPPTRARAIGRAFAKDQPRAGVAEGMTRKMTDALRGTDSSGVRSLVESASFEHERAILNDACGWSDEPIKVVMDRGRLSEASPVTTWYLLGGG